jgi:hypothetical protein
VNPRRLAPALLLHVCVSGSVVLASIPDSNGVIHGCVSKSGQLRVIDSATETCKKNESPIAWTAQPGEGPATSDPSVFDADGAYVGSLDPGENLNDNDRVTIRLSTGEVLVPLVNRNEIVAPGGGLTVWFTTTDCSGQGYVEGGSGLTARIYHLPGKIVYPGGPPPFPGRTMNSRHRFNSDGTEIEPCQVGVELVFSGPYSEFDLTVFVPPFHVV